MERPLVSIGLLTYNHEKYIADALEGLLSQDYERMELIVLDDASEDRTCTVIEEYRNRLEKKFERLLIIKNEKNGGNIPHNCNCMMQEAKGDFYFEASGDDVVLPLGVRVLCETLQKQPDCMIVHANMIRVQDGYTFGDDINVNDTIWKKRQDGTEPDNLFQLLMNGNCIAAPTVMLRREVFDKYGYHDEDIAYEDYEYWLRISRMERFYFVNASVVLRRLAEVSVTNFDGEKTYRKLRVAINADFLAKKKYIGQLRSPEQIECWRTYYAYYYNLCTQYQFQDGLKWLNQKMAELGVEVGGSQISYKEMFEKQKKDTEILMKWLAIKNVPEALGNYLRSIGVYQVALYGYLHLGTVLQKELLHDGIAVDYVIDRKGSMLECPFPVYTIEDDLPDTDAVIVVPVGLYKIVEPILEEKTNVKVLDFCQMIEEIKSNYELTGSI